MTPESYQHFRPLLNQKGSVSLPGLGTFSYAFRPAALVQNQERMLPPTEVIQFDPEVQLGALYSSRLTEVLFIHPEVAQEMEAELGEYFRQKLQNEKQVVLPGLGYLQLQTPKPLAFVPEPAQKANSSDQFYGLQPVLVKPKPKKRSGRPGHTRSRMKNGTQTHEKLNGHTPINWQPYLLVGLLVMIGVLIIYNGPFMNQRTHLAQGVVVNVEQSTPFRTAPEETNSPQIAANNPAPTKVSLPATSSPTSAKQGVSRGDNGPAEETARLTKEPIRNRSVEPASPNVSAEPAQEQTHLSDLQVTVNDHPNKLEAAKPVSKQIPVFHLISASFTRMEAAEEYATDFQSKGYVTEILVPTEGPSTILRVSIFQSNDPKEVRDFQKHLQLAGKELLWIFEEKSTPNP